MSKKFDPTKPVQLRNGLKARIVSTKIGNNTDKTIAAIITRMDNSEYVAEFYPNGYSFHRDKQSDFDLINPPVLVKAHMWAVLYSTGAFDCYRSERDARAASDLLRNAKLFSFTLEHDFTPND